ncbi:virulence factor TspB C-terminal domain-related protein [Acinetobacter sp. 22512]|uniref:virulence factor TspB C-terminal domain-related protein n=1 Tax=unclassified Acinetobacter TaxID=196816 RepID=UPI003F83220F
MVNRLCFRNLRIDNFKLITWLQIFIIAITPNFIFFQSANATTVSAEGWSVTKRLVQGATTFYDGAKNVVLNGKNYAATGTAAITPTATQVSKMIVRTGAVLAVDLAIKTLIGAVDYVMDPANNRVKYFVVGDPSDPKDPSVQYYYQTGAFGVTKYFSSNSAAATDQCTRNAQGYGWILVSATPYNWTTSEVGMRDAKCVIKRSPTDANETFNWGYQRILNPAYNPAAPNPNTQEKYLPYDAVASQIISDAVANKADGKAYVSSVADTALEQDEQRQIVPANDMVQQLNSSQAIPTSNTAQGQAVPQTNPDDPTAPKAPPTDITLNFPVFCEWAPTVCQAAQAAIDFPKTVADYWKKTDKWMNESASDTSETKPEVKELELNFDDGSRINFDQTCPQPQPIQVTFMGVTQDASFSFEPLCNFMIMIRPFVIGSAYLIGAYIVMGLSRGNSE